ncbi:MAG: enoyl-CoA hydratase/isomerase family protein [Parvularculaceae bacterium]
MTNEILFERRGEWGVVTLNRPQALNALSWDMCKAFRATLIGWQGDSAVRAVLIKGAGEKAFCAGGDIRWLHHAAKKDPVHASEFFRDEYRLDAAIHHFTKPYVAIIDGIVMGGGVGVSVHGDFRVAGDRTLFAMPETAIGLFPDVGGGHFMPRLHDGLGLYYGLTGARAKAADCMAAGIATHYAPSAKMAELEDALIALSFGSHAHADIEAVLDRFADDPGAAPINDVRGQIARLFLGHESFEDFWAALSRNDGVFGVETFETLKKMSPTSMKLTFEQMKRGHDMDFDHVMQMEFRIVSHVMQGHDFFEGVRAVILDKDKNPKWAPTRVDEVSDAQIAAYFDNIGERELQLP